MPNRAYQACCDPEVAGLPLLALIGDTQTDKVIKLHVEPFDEYTGSYIIDFTPAVISCGKRVMNMGYTFIWL